MIDPTGKVKTLLKEYQSQDSDTEEERIIREILRQMIYDSESIPVHYYASPFFVNTKIIDKNRSLMEDPTQFHKMVVK